MEFSLAFPMEFIIALRKTRKKAKVLLRKAKTMVEEVIERR